MLDEALKGAERVGGGFYADVFEIMLEGSRRACKVYRVKGLAREEARQLAVLSENGVKCPETFGTDVLSDGREVLIMGFVDGVNACDASVPPTEIEDAGRQIVEQALIMHAATNESGYGFVCSGERFSEWKAFYHAFSEAILREALKNAAAGRISPDVLEACQKAYARFEVIFSKEPIKPSLIHGDFNPMNVMLDPETGKLNAVIDPIGSMWGDREYELFQLKCNGGERYRLFERYAENVKLSDNYPEKEAFYAAFAELNHFNRLLSTEYASSLKPADAAVVFEKQNEICRNFARMLSRRLGG